MAILKGYFSQSSCEVEIKLKLVSDSSVKFIIYFRFGESFPEVQSEILCMKRDFFKLLEDLEQIDIMHLSMLEPNDPGLCIYHIPQFGTYYYPGFGVHQLPENEIEERELYYKLIFVLDAGEINNKSATECGPAICLVVKLEQIAEFVNNLKSELINF